MALNLNPFSAFIGKFTPNPEIVTTAATVTLLDRTHYSSSGHSGGGYHSSGHSGGGYHHYHYSKKKKKSMAMNALTLLSFMFFLNMLQNCIQEHINQMNPTTIVMQMQTTASTIRNSNRKGDDGGELTNNITFAEDVESERSKNTLKIEDFETTTRQTRRRNTNKSKKRRKDEREKLDIRPTKPTMFYPEEEYQYTQVPVKLKLVERFSDIREN